MPIRPPEKPVRFVPRGLVDAYDSTDKFPGACLSLANLIFDQSNPEFVVSRPGVGTAFATFELFTTPGAISVQVTIGNIVYGMIASGLNVGKDQPFAYNLSTSAFIAIAGITNATSPTTQATTGAWTPPTMAVVGTNLIVTHPGFSATAFKFGVIDLTNLAAPTWTATDTTTNALSDIPTSVANYNNRAYFAVSNKTEYTDVLTLVRTSANQVLTIGDTSAVTALSGLPITTTSSGVVGALIVFKNFSIWQVTGDPANTPANLALNFLSLQVGTDSPRSLALSPQGLYFRNIAGPYMIDPLGAVRPVTYSAQSLEPDMQVAFQAAVVPSRAAGCYSNGIYRICMETVVRGVQATNDYWFDERKRRWTGPHSFSYDCASAYSNYFILNSNASTAKLFKSQSVNDSTTVYTDQGVALTSSVTTSTFPKDGVMAERQVVESTIELASSGSPTSYNVIGQNDVGVTLDNVNVTVSPAGTPWGSFIWGDGTLWTSSQARPQVYTVPWTQPLVFQKMGLTVSATSSAQMMIGSFFARYQNLGYTGASSIS